jgi:hypothetical protein
MPVGTINVAKELRLAFQPLLLATLTFHDGAVLRLSTHNLNSADGSYNYAGHAYLPRVMNQDIAALAALSEGGVDVPPSVTLRLNDGDQLLWRNWEATKGFRGARLQLTFVFWNVGANDFSSDSMTPFVGTCSAPQMDATTLTVTAQSLLALQQVTLPTLRVQPRCPWPFPRTALERQDGADNDDSWFFECGYSPDASGANARGNLNAGSPFTTCEYNRQDCEARGMFARDGANRVTSRNGAVAWDPPKSWKSRSYLAGKEVDGVNSSNEAKYNDPVPLVYGTTWVEPVVANVQGDGNTTRLEAILCAGYIGDIQKVVVNDTDIPAAHNMDGSSRIVSDANFAWYLVNRGARTGGANALPGWGGEGDPYGSMATIAVVVPKVVAESGSAPRIRVLLSGPRVRRYTGLGDGDYEWVFGPQIGGWSGGGKNMNNAWVLMDLLIRAGLSYSDFHRQSWIDGAAVADGLVSYTAQDGATLQHPRFLAALSVKQRRSAAEVIRGVRNAGRMLIYPDPATGKLKLVVRQTLAAQQPAAVAGSNYNTAIASKLASGTAANGYVAYRFDAGSILRSDNGDSTLRLASRSNSELPTRMSLQYPDIHNNFALDSISITDTESLVRNSNTEAPQSFPLEGICSFDHAKRAIAVWMAEQLRGNPRTSPVGDAGATLVAEFETSFKGLRLELGQICLLHMPSRGIENQLVRIQRIAPTTNWERCRIVATYHSDEWYVDSFGQEDPGKYAGNARNRLARPPYPLLGQVQTGGLTNPDPLRGRERTFGLESKPDADGRYRAIARMIPPANTFPAGLRPPFVPFQGSVTSTGGGLAGNRDYYVALCAVNADAEISPHSQLCRVAIPAGTNTNKLTVPSIDWGDGTTGYALFVGTHPMQLWHQANGGSATFTGAPSAIEFAGPIDESKANFPIPDGEYDFVRIKVKKARNLGVFGSEISGVTATTITIAGARWTVDQWAGRDCSIIGSQEGFDTCRDYSFRIVSNTTETLTVSTAFSPAPDAVIDFADDKRWLLVMRTKAGTVTEDTITDTGWDNSLAVAPEVLYVADASNDAPIDLNIAGHGLTTGDRVRVDFVGGNTAANGIFPVTVIDDNYFSLDGTTGSGEYTTGGVVRKLLGGLSADEAKGKLLRLIAGKGRGAAYRIASNTATAITIEGIWADTPDATTRFITEEPGWAKIIDTTPATVSTAFPSQPHEFQLDLEGLERQALICIVVPVDGGGNEAVESLCQVRDFFLYNSLARPLAEREVRSSTVVGQYDRRLLVYTDQVAVTVTFDGTVRRVADPLEIKHVEGSFDCTLVMASGDTFDDGSTSKVLAVGEAFQLALSLT